MLGTATRHVAAEFNVARLAHETVKAATPSKNALGSLLSDGTDDGLASYNTSIHSTSRPFPNEQNVSFGHHNESKKHWSCRL